MAAAHLHNSKAVESVKTDIESSDVSPKMKALLRIAGMVQKSGRDVSEAAVEDAKKEGAREMDIHDTVLIAAAFCMFNRYVDGLGTEMPEHMAAFAGRGSLIAEKGYAAMAPPASPSGDPK